MSATCPDCPGAAGRLLWCPCGSFLAPRPRGGTCRSGSYALTCSLTPRPSAHERTALMTRPIPHSIDLDDGTYRLIPNKYPRPEEVQRASDAVRLAKAQHEALARQLDDINQEASRVAGQVRGAQSRHAAAETVLVALANGYGLERVEKKAAMGIDPRDIPTPGMNFEGGELAGGRLGAGRMAAVARAQEASKGDG